MSYDKTLVGGDRGPRVLAAGAGAPRPNTGNLAPPDDGDQVGRGLDDVPVDGLLCGERGAVCLAHDAGVMTVAASVEPFQQFGCHFACGAAQL